LRSSPSSLASAFKSVRFSYYVFQDQITGAIELTRQLTGKKVRKSFPEFVVTEEVSMKPVPAVLELEFLDGEKVQVEASGLNTPQLMDKVRDRVAQVRHRQWLSSLAKKPPQFPE